MGDYDPTLVTEGTQTPDALFAGDYPRITEDVTVLSGQNLVRGSVVGKQTASTVPTTGDGTGNTGDGTCGSVAAGGADIQAGTYTLKCVTAATDGGEFVVIAPDGSIVGYALVGVAFTSSHLNFTIADGATDFIVGDAFTIAVTGSGKWKLAAAAATDGSAKVLGVLAEAADASSGDVEAVIYRTGEFSEAAVTLGSGHTVAALRDELAGRGIFFRANTA